MLSDIYPDESADVDSIVIDRIIFEHLLKKLDGLMLDACHVVELRLAEYSDGAIADIPGIPRTTFLV